MSNPTHALVTGGAGFIGSHLCERLIALGGRVTVIDNFSTGQPSNIDLLGDRVTLVPGTVGDVLTDRPELLDGVDEVYHLAATVGVQLVVQDPRAMIRNNVDQTGIVIDAAAKRGLPILLASSSEVYGRSTDLPLTETGDLLYGPTTSPRWSYGMGKALDEHIALASHRSEGLPVVIARLFNTIGPRQVGHYGMVVPRFVEQACRDAELTIHGDGQQSRAFCDVRDVVRALVDLLRHPPAQGQIYNVGSDQVTTIEALADLVIAIAGAGRKVMMPYEQAFDRNFEDMRHRVPSVAKLRDAIAFEREYSLDRTLSELVQARRDSASRDRS